MVIFVDCQHRIGIGMPHIHRAIGFQAGARRSSVRASKPALKTDPNWMFESGSCSSAMVGRLAKHGPLGHWNFLASP